MDPQDNGLLQMVIKLQELLKVSLHVKCYLTLREISFLYYYFSWLFYTV